MMTEVPNDFTNNFASVDGFARRSRDVRDAGHSPDVLACAAKTGGSQVSEFVSWGSQQISRSTCSYRPTPSGPNNCLDTGKIEWQFAKSNKFVSVLYGDWRFVVLRDGLSTEIGTFDEVTQLVTGQNRQTPHRQGYRRKSSRGTLGWYKPDLFYGNHEFKTGYDYSPGAWGAGKVLACHPSATDPVDMKQDTVSPALAQRSARHWC